MYKKHDIENMLKKYLVSTSQLDKLERRIEKNKITLKYAGEKFEQTEEETIEEMALKAPVISDVPKRKNK